jgi:D-glycero-D-manno-heptose 1,7-bisphosphate phosphatase
MMNDGVSGEKRRGRRAVFLDRDGTLNVEVDFLRKPEELVLIAGAGDAVRKLNEHGLITCVISNQSGVARGYLTEAELDLVHAKLRDELSRSESALDAIYYCPHHPSAGIPPYDVNCECRKPKPGMMLRGAREFNLDLRRSFVVGDSTVDMQAGNAVGATTILVQTGYGVKALAECNEKKIPIARVADSIVEAVTIVLETCKGDTRECT